MKKKFKEIMAVLLSLFMVVGMINMPFVTIKDVEAAEITTFSLTPEYSSYTFNYADAMYDEGKSVLLMIRVSPALTDEYTYTFNSQVCNMMWSVFEERTQENSNVTELVFRGNTQFIGETMKEGTLSIDIVKKSNDADLASYGHVDIPISYVDSEIDNSNSYTITFDANGGEYSQGSIEHEYVIEGSEIQGMPWPNIDEKKVFIGYKIAGDETEKIYRKGSVAYEDGEFFSIKPTCDMTFIAVYADAYSVLFDYDGAKVQATLGGELEDASIYERPNMFEKNHNLSVDDWFGSWWFNSLTKDGFELEGWKIEDSEDDTLYSYPSEIMCDKDMTIKAIWKQSGENYQEPGVSAADACTIIFDLNGGYTLTGPLKDKSYDNYELSVAVNDTIYNGILQPYNDDDTKVFLGWHDIEVDRSLYTSDELRNIVFTTDKTFVAQWSNTVEVSFDSNGGYFTEKDGQSTNSVVYRWKEKQSLNSEDKYYIPEPTREGYSFVGWLFSDPKSTLYNGGIFSNNNLAGIPLYNDTSLIAQWKENSTDNNQNNKENVTPPSSPKQTSNTSNNNGKQSSSRTVKPRYSNEWVDGKWYDKNGKQTYSGSLSWKKNSTGWWVEDTANWYPQSQWQKIDGTWYYFKSDGYMASNEYYNGYWFNSDGSWDSQYYLTWKSNSTGWWVEDKSGWWPSNSWLKIDGNWYYFNGSGYMAASQYVDGWWVGSDGVCR